MSIILRSLVVIFLALLWEPASAQETPSPEALRAANELASIISTDMMDQMSREISAQMWPRLERELGTRVDEATLSDLRSEFDRLLANFAGEAKKDAPSLYARYFSEQELHDITTFYRTPTGTKALKLMPRITGEYMTSTLLPLTQQFNRKLQESMNDVLRKHGYKDMTTKAPTSGVPSRPKSGDAPRSRGKN